MKALPSFLKISSQPGTTDKFERSVNFNPYYPLIGLWLIDMALTGDWLNEPPSGSLATTFADSDYLRVTGLKGIENIFPDSWSDDEDQDRRIAELEALEDGDLLLPKAKKSKRLSRTQIKQTIEKALLRRRRELLKKSVDGDLPLFQNVRRAARLLHLTEAEQAVLTFAACMTCFGIFRSALIQNHLRVSNGEFAQLLAVLTGQPYADIRKAIHRNSVLMTAGLVRMEYDEADLEDKIKITRALREVILDNLTSDEELSSRVLRLAAPGKLSIEDFPHLSRDIKLLQAYLKRVMSGGVRGSNVLLYGSPGCGKTELAKALIASLGGALYEIAYANNDGDPIDGEQRLQNYNF